MSPSVLGILACIVNFHMLVFNVGFTRWDAIAALDSNVFSLFGQAMILVWGIAFLAAGLSDDGKSLVWFAFAVEKLAYVTSWVLWHARPDSSSTVSSVVATDFACLASGACLTQLLPKLFVTIYGPVDFAFLLAFTYQGTVSLKAREATQSKRSKVA
jgi:hypothetical protein